MTKRADVTYRMGATAHSVTVEETTSRGEMTTSHFDMATMTKRGRRTLTRKIADYAEMVLGYRPYRGKKKRRHRTANRTYMKGRPAAAAA